MSPLISVGPLGTQRESGAYACLLLRVTLGGPLLYQGLSFLSCEMGTPDILHPCEWLVVHIICCSFGIHLLGAYYVPAREGEKHIHGQGVVTLIENNNAIY